ncbi:MAG: type II toxin-antitoxin system MqsA family antitoxin [Bacteroidetes bacterium]|nr:type II toxin-antitoxin system MqsA family antitoxin [Bacteroidota bacterium]
MKEEICAICGGEKVDSTTSFTVDFNNGVVVVRDVPAKVCMQCGEEWISDEIASKLEGIVSIAKKQNQEIFVAKFGSYSLAS